MSADPVTAVADAVTGILSLAKPLIDEHLAQAYDNEFTEACHQIQVAVDLADPARADELHALCVRLCSDNGQTAGGLGDDFCRVRVSNIAALLTIAAAAKRDKQKLAAATSKLGK